MKKRNIFRWFFYRSRGDSPAKRSLIHVVLIAACILSIYPALRVASVSIRPGNRVLSTDLALIPQGATFEAYVNVVQNRDFLLWVWNSLFITITTSLIGVIIASTAAYGFSRWSFPGRTPGLIGLLATQMIPAPMLMIPLYILAARLNLINTYRGLVIAYSVSAIPFSIWILKGYYDTIPVELEQSAMIDGSSRMGAFYRIILPLSAPSLAIAFLFNFTSSWNEYLLARIILQKKELLTWTLGLRQMQGQFQTQWAEFSAGAIMISIPVMALFFWSSKWLISGLTLGSVKE
jgi:arabinogalactan oligomer / maltooligosaccharide transport system permease protein